MKKILLVLLMIMVIATSLTSCALVEELLSTKTEVIDGIEYTTGKYFRGSYSVSGLADKSLTEIVIPESIKGKSVVSIKVGAFKDQKQITSVVLPNSITSIGQCAFEGCSSLNSINLPKGISSIDYRTFCYCPLNSVVIPEGVKTIGVEAFAHSGVSSVVLPESLVTIQSGAFESCPIRSIVIPKNVTEICDYDTMWFDGISPAFADCYIKEIINYSALDIVPGSSANGEIALHAIKVHDGTSENINYNDFTFYTYNGVNYLMDYVGDDTDLVLPESYNGEEYVISLYAFEDLENITSIKIPNSVTSIGIGAFAGCTSLASVEIPSSVTSIGIGAFYGCTSLASVEISGSVTSIGKEAFMRCSSLASIVIPNSVTSIDWFAFYKCTSLKDVYYTGTEEEWKNVSIGTENYELINATIHYNYVPEE